MGTVNFIFNTEIFNVWQTATVNTGNAINLYNRSNFKDIGGATPIGDFGVNFSAAANQNIDPDVVDQV